MTHFRKPLSADKRSIYTTVAGLLVLALLAASSCIPFLWESKSLWYKFGVDRTLLQLGKVAGLFAAILLFIQLTLAVKHRWLERVLGLDKMYYLHQINGYLVVSLAIVHISLVLIPEGITNLPIGWKFWPELTGAAVFLGLVAIILSIRLRGKIIPYKLWRTIHRPVGYILVGGIFVHILYVSDSFENAVPKAALIGLSALVLLIVVSAKILLARCTYSNLAPVEIQRVTDSIYSVNMTAPAGFAYAPGQFGFLSFHGADADREPHPFTIASAPEKTDTLQFYIKMSGDWTSHLEKNGDGEPRFSGPFGLFSCTSRDMPDHLVFIAGGIGITPILSMLRYLACLPQQPAITLVWSLRSTGDMFLERELVELKKKMNSLHFHIHYTQKNRAKRLDKDLLQDLLPENLSSCHCYICGPKKMMTATRKDLKDLGCTTRQIFTEEFSL